MSTSSSRGSARKNALLKLFDSELRGRFGAQVAKLAVVFITLGYAIALPFAARGPRDSSDLVVVRALSWASWLVAGLVALAACHSSNDEETALDSFARQHGWNDFSIATARSLSVVRRTARLVLPSGLLLGFLALGLSSSFGAILPRISLILGVVVYVALLAIGMALLVRVARALSPAHPRSALLALVIVPHVIRGIVPSMPSVPALYHWLLVQLSSLGAVP
jgi:Trk-type K+ transport system membrane component